MRTMILPVLALSLASASVAMASQPSSDTKRFGAAYCSQNMACPTDDKKEDGRIIAASATCISRYFGFRGTVDDLFDKERGLDYNSCLSSLSQKSTNGESFLQATCCAIPMDDAEDLCQIKCTLDLTR